LIDDGKQQVFVRLMLPNRASWSHCDDVFTNLFGERGGLLLLLLRSALGERRCLFVFGVTGEIVAR
jgi:hypothetical protein